MILHRLPFSDLYCVDRLENLQKGPNSKPILDQGGVCEFCAKKIFQWPSFKPAEFFAISDPLLGVLLCVLLCCAHK